MEDISDEKLIQKYLEGDKKSLEILIEKYLKQIYNFIYKNVGSVSDSEDITQEVFVKVWKNIRKFDQKKNFRPWIFQIAKNTSIDFLRKKKTIPFSNFENEKGQNPLAENIAEKPLNLIEKLSDEKTLQSAIQGLSPEEKKLVNLRNTEEFTFKEIAEMLKRPINTIKSRYRRIILNLRNTAKR